ncbi:MAG: autotransporter-associated beta strand repeat-containing protein [Planctomycetia bacterium]|nr:autotransporter-associated beta strand repeat-containing protein [Planctomycetia bacterium]
MKTLAPFGFKRIKLSVWSLFFLSTAVLLAWPTSALAATGTWNGPSLTGTWNTTDTNWTGVAAGTPWAAQGNVASFNTSGNVATVSGGVFADVLSLNSQSNSLTVPASQSITLNVSNAHLNIGGAGHATSADGNTLIINGTVTYGPSGSGSGWLYVGDDGGGDQANPGTASSYNSIVINSGGLLQDQSNGSGTHNDRIGFASGANFNYVDINGGTWNRAGQQRLYVGVQGDSNYMLIHNGGTLTGTTSLATWGGAGERVLQIGDGTGGGTGNGGSSNSVTVNGSTASARIAQQLTVGSGTTANDNYMKIENGGDVYVAFSGNTSFIGTSGDNNYIQVTGSGSTLNVSNSGNSTRFLTVGIGATADNNHLDVYSGASADLRTGLIFGNTGATNSKFNLGDGTGISTASVGNTGVANAVLLSDATSRLTINSGRLIAIAATGNLVSGLGQIALNGPAYFSVPTAATSSITSQISGSGGNFTKEGAGVLVLAGANASNDYTGNTVITNGTLQVGTVAFNAIPNGSGKGNVVIDGGATFAGVLDIHDFDEAINGLSGVTGTVLGQVVNNGNGLHTLTVGDGDATASFAGTILDTTVVFGIGQVGLSKTGSGTQTLSGNNTYTGATSVNNGTLVLNGSHTPNSIFYGGAGSYNIGATGTLKGSGITNGDLLVTGGTVAPGNSIESLGVGSISFSGGTYEYEINTSTTTADLLYGDDGSTLTLTGSPVLSLFDLGGNLLLPLGTKFTLIAYDGLWNNGTFLGYADDSTFSFAGNSWLINYNDASPGSNFLADATAVDTAFVTITTVATGGAVPEPATFALGALGLVGLGALVVRRRRKQA